MVSELRSPVRWFLGRTGWSATGVSGVVLVTFVAAMLVYAGSLGRWRRQPRPEPMVDEADARDGP